PLVSPTRERREGYMRAAASRARDRSLRAKFRTHTRAGHVEGRKKSAAGDGQLCGSPRTARPPAIRPPFSSGFYLLQRIPSENRAYSRTRVPVVASFCFRVMSSPQQHRGARIPLRDSEDRVTLISHPHSGLLHSYFSPFLIAM